MRELRSEDPTPAESITTTSQGSNYIRRTSLQYVDSMRQERGKQVAQFLYPSHLDVPIQAVSEIFINCDNVALTTQEVPRACLHRTCPAWDTIILRHSSRGLHDPQSTSQSVVVLPLSHEPERNDFGSLAFALSSYILIFLL